MTDTDVRVLVVHGDAADLAVLASVAAAHAFDMRVVDAGGDLVAEILRYQPDAIVLDLKARVGDGRTICRAIKSDPATAGVPVILTGSAVGPEARSDAVAAGCDDFLEKPIHRHVLAYRLRSYARLRRVWGFAALRRDALLLLRDAVARGELDAELVETLERWLQEQPHEVEP